jgi:hypothetical protein
MSKEDIIRDRSAEPEINVLRDTNSMQVMVEVCPISLMSASPVSMFQMMMVQSSEALANLGQAKKCVGIIQKRIDDRYTIQLVRRCI